MSDEHYILRAQIIKALGHPTRLRIVERLAERETCVCDLQELVGGDISTVSKHLAVLRNAGIVSDRKEGLSVFYRLRAPCVLRFLECIDEVLTSRFVCASPGRGELPPPVAADGRRAPELPATCSRRAARAQLGPAR